MIVIFSYNRPEMLKRLIEECPERPIVIDDGSDFDPMDFVPISDFYRLNHKGREGFWANWDYAMKICKHSKDDYFTFLADDFYSVKWDLLETIKQDEPFAFNLLNDGRKNCFTQFKYKDTMFHSIPSWEVGFVDCGYHCNRAALEVLDFTMPPVDPSRWIRPYASSGVGSYQSVRFLTRRVPMYIPKKSFVKHGNHESKMHPELRKKDPLIDQ